jgi:superfamily II DNA or RNA helicase
MNDRAAGPRPPNPGGVGPALKVVIRNFLYLEAPPPELLATLKERLTLPNPKWLENERMGRWNRGTPKELRFYRLLKGGGLRIPRGYMRQLVLTCRRLGLECLVDDRRRTLDPVDLAFHGTLKPFQDEAVRRMLTRDFGTLSAPTGCGKTVMALFIVARRRQPALIVVHTRELADQWRERIHQFLGVPPGEVGFIGAGRRTIGPRVTVAMVQSLYKCGRETAPGIGQIVVDECHRIPSRTFTDAVTQFDARFMLGLSATPWRRDRLSQLIFWHLGDMHHDIPRETLVASGDVLPAVVVLRETAFRPYFDPVSEYTRMLAELTADPERNQLIVADVARECAQGPGVCLVLSDRKAHCENLKLLLRFRHGVEAELLTGDLRVGQRREVLERLREGRVRVLIATGQLVGEGFDCPDLSTLFMATPIRFSGRLLQYLGRVLRPAPGKHSARVFDYVDIHVETLVSAARARQRVYNA